GSTDPEVVLTNVSLPFGVSGNMGVNPGLNQVYVPQGTNTVVALDGTTGTIVGTAVLGANLGSVGSVTVDATRNRVYALAYGGASAYLYVFQFTPALVSPTFANYIDSYSIMTQAVVTASTFQDITNDVNNQISGWTHAAGSVSFTNNQIGLYLVQYT